MVSLVLASKRLFRSPGRFFGLRSMKSLPLARASRAARSNGWKVKPREEWQLATRRLGRRVLVFDQVDSTNSLCASFAEDRPNEGLVILADCQTAGRGQHGRSWTCEPGVGVLMSSAALPASGIRRPVILAAWAANAVCETVWMVTGRDAQIKWPNDVLMAGRKVCGILIEQAAGTVVGIGLNVCQSRIWFIALAEGGNLARCFQ